MKPFSNAILMLFISLTFISCGAVKTSPTAQNIASRNWTINQESPRERRYCNNPTFYEENHNVFGRALYQYREISIELGERGLKEIAEDPKPIRHAQIEIVDALGNILQCGETDGDGYFLLKVPRNEKALTLNLYSRSDNNFNRASVFKAPETNELYKLQHFFTANQDHDDIELLARADKDLMGGAFNILDQIHNAMDKLKAVLINSSGRAPETIPKVDIYWEKGFNPGVYIGNDSGLSFFSKPQQKLFILGGLNGDVDFADTDHFDNSIILHEYFHFLESTISRSDSPGGPHSGDELLDPRLAWSEGAAQFFQALVTGIPTVFDTRGNPDGDTGFYVKYSIEEAVTDIPVENGEGEFREFAVARLLWDIFDNEDGEAAPENFDTVVNRFPLFWEAFTNSPSLASFNNSSSRFASAGLALEIMNALSTMGTEWGSLLYASKFAFPYRSNFVLNPGANDPLWNSNTHLTRYAQTIEPCSMGSPSDNFKMVTGPREYQPSNVLNENHPVANVDHFRVTVPDGSDFSLGLRMGADTPTNFNGSLQMYVLPDGYTNLAPESYSGPFLSGNNVLLPSGTYLLMVVIETRASSTDSNPAEANYYFDGYCKGGF